MVNVRTSIYIYIYVTARPLSPQEGASLTLAPINRDSASVESTRGGSHTLAPIIINDRVQTLQARGLLLECVVITSRMLSIMGRA